MELDREAKGGKRGFTLIELAIVLVVIGLIVGGVLAGQDMIKAAQVRATLTQLEKFNTAVNTFKGKYGELPGDMSQASAIKFGFPPFQGACNNSRCGTQGRGDGNGVLDSFTSSLVSSPSSLLGGETAMFWGDLGYANLIEGSFTTDQYDAGLANIANVDTVLPAAQLGNSTHFMVYGYGSSNYFGIIKVSSIAGNGFYTPGTPGLTVAQAYAIDAKIDDGNPQSGRVTATYVQFVSGNILWWAVGGGAQTGAAPGSAASPSSTTCYDNGGNTSNPMAYSLTQNNGAGVNCALSFQFQ